VYYADGPIEPTNPDLEQEVGAKTEGLVLHYCGNPDVYYEICGTRVFLVGGLSPVCLIMRIKRYVAPRTPRMRRAGVD
jgi:hypothetical protein